MLSSLCSKLSVTERSWQACWLWEWRVRWWQVLVSATGVRPSAPHLQLCVCVCVCARIYSCAQSGTEDSCSSVSQQVSDLLTVTPHLFVYDRHHQQLVWNQAAVTWRTERREHSLPGVCPASLGVVTAGRAEHWSSHLFKVTTVQHFFFTIRQHFFKSPESHRPLGRQ